MPPTIQNLEFKGSGFGISSFGVYGYRNWDLGFMVLGLGIMD